MTRLVIAASGPYLDIDAVRVTEIPTMAINSTVFDIPEARYLHFCDAEWFLFYERMLPAGIEMSTLDEVAAIYAKAAHLIRTPGSFDFCRESPYVPDSLNSAGHAINRAYHLGYREVFLCGVDCCDGPEGAHYFGDHPEGLNNPDSTLYPKWIEGFERLNETKPDDLTIWNCDRKSAVSCFQYQELPWT